MFTRLFSLFAEKPAPKRNIDVSNLFPVNDEASPTIPKEGEVASSTPRRRNRHRGSYASNSSPSTMRFR